MKRFSKNIAALCLACVMILSLCSCSAITIDFEDILEIFLPASQSQTRFFLNTEYLTIIKEDTFELTVAPQSGVTPPPYTIEWLSDNTNIVTVNDGVLYAVAQGVTNVRARLTVNTSTPYTKDLVCTVTVTQSDVSLIALDLNTTSLTMTKGDADKLVPIFTPADTTETSVCWVSSNPDVVTVGADGTVVANKEGSANILVYSEKDDTISAVCKITVEKGSENQVKSVKIDATSATLKVGDTKQLKATVSATSFTGNVIWSSDNMDVATVTQDGLVTAIAKGSTYITATAGNKSAACKITVSNTSSNIIPCTSVSLDRTDVRVVDGPTTFKISAVCSPLNTTEVGTWSTSNSKVAAVTAGGTVSVLSQAKSTEVKTAIIKYTVSGSVYATCAVTVVPSSLLANSVTLDQTAVSLAPEDTLPLTMTTDVIDSADKWVWTSSDQTVATVSETGVITAVGKGTATVTVSSQDRSAVKASCAVTVNPIPVDVTLTTLTGEAQFTSFNDIVIKPLFSDETAVPASAEYVLSVNNKHASVDSAFFTNPNELFVMPVSSGEIVVSLTIQSGSSRFQYNCTPITITLALPAVTALGLDEEAVTLSVGETADLSVTFTPTECTGHYDLAYASSDASVITVDEDGTMTAVASGSATVRISVKDDDTVFTECTVTVTEQPSSSDSAE